MGTRKSMRPKVLLAFGTRPEAIKMAPVVQALRRSRKLKPVVCVTAQHRDLLDQVLRIFRIRSDYDLDIMTDRQTLVQITNKALRGMTQVLEEVKPSVVLVQGDTTTTFAASLAGFYQKIPVGHVEAGLRTYDKRNPFPEEINRRLTTHLADVHYAPTPRARENLLREGVPASSIVVTGNTVVDALHWMLSRLNGSGIRLRELAGIDWQRSIPILVTTHRRENFGPPLRRIVTALIEILALNQRIHIILPVHPNPSVRRTVRDRLAGRSRIHLLSPLPYAEFLLLMSRSRLVLTDSGGVQEEVASLGKPVVVMRQATERPEVIEAGYGLLAGTETEAIVGAVRTLLSRPFDRKNKTPFGDGKAAGRIVQHLENWLSD